ncbi:MAG TPA: hypothetical protein VIK85_00455 [Coriobacteriia bacterium]
MKRGLLNLVVLAFIAACLFVTSGCTAPSTSQSTTAATAAPSTDASGANPATAALAFDAQGFVDSIEGTSTSAMATALNALPSEQRDEVQAILTARLAAAQAATPKVYEHLSTRGFKLLAKDPDSYVGKKYYIYGQITQFDAATGTEMFLAAVGPKKLRKSYGYVFYPQPAFLNGTDSQLKKYVVGDLFTAKVTVLGSYSYDTQAGGRTTVPQFQIDSISRNGSAK